MQVLAVWRLTPQVYNATIELAFSNLSPVAWSSGAEIEGSGQRDQMRTLQRQPEVPHVQGSWPNRYAYKFTCMHRVPRQKGLSGLQWQRLVDEIKVGSMIHHQCQPLATPLTNAPGPLRLPPRPHDFGLNPDSWGSLLFRLGDGGLGAVFWHDEVAGLGRF